MNVETSEGTSPGHPRSGSRTAVVVGGSGGIGQATARTLAERGFDPIVVTYFSNEAAVAKTMSDVHDAGAHGVAVQVDVSRSTDLAVLAETFGNYSDRLDALVYCAGYRVLRPTMTMDEESWQGALNVSLNGFVHSVQQLTPRMASGGKVVGVSGLSGVRAYSPNHMAMGTSKAASHHAMTYLAWDLAERGINLNMACFGAVLTDGVKEDLTPEQYEELIAGAGRSDKIPLGRVATVEDVARIIAFLCSPDAGWLVGQVIVADGGETLR